MIEHRLITGQTCMVGRVDQFITSSNRFYFQFSSSLRQFGLKHLWQFSELQCYICSETSILTGGKRHRIKVSIQTPKNSKSWRAKSNQTDAPFVSLAASSWISLKEAFIASTFLFFQTDVILKRRCTNGRLLQFPNKFEKIQAHERDFMSSICYRWSSAEYDRIFKFSREISLCIYSNVLCNHFCWGLLFAAAVAIKVYWQATPEVEWEWETTTSGIRWPTSLFSQSVWVLLTSHRSAVFFIVLLLED